MLERMDKFFEKRLQGYEEHMLTAIESADAFYPFTAECLPDKPGCRVVDLGCGTGLELDWYFRRCPDAHVTCVDLSCAMLDALRRKFPERKIVTINASYFDFSLGLETFDGAVSVESLHHFTAWQKVPLYRGLRRSLRPGAPFILTDYFATDEADEARWMGELNRMRKEQGLPESVFFHYDIPLTVEHEREALLEAGFSRVEQLARWGNTCTLRAVK